MNLTPLRALLKQEFSHEVCLKILQETSLLFREDISTRWYFLLLHRIFAAIIDNPDFHDADTAMPILEVLRLRASDGIDAVEQRSAELLISAANQLTEVYCAIP